MRALCLAGGGAHGAYEVGAILHLMAELGIDYDLFAGVSVGALNGGFLAQFEDGKEAAGKLHKLWLTIKTKLIYRHWFPFGFLSWWKPSLYNSKPLHKLVRENFDQFKVRTSGKALRIGAVSMGGEYRAFDERYDGLAKAILASSSFPAFLLPIKIEGKWWTDGGVKNITPLLSAIEAGATAVDVIMTSPAEPVYEEVGDPPRWYEIALRSIDLMSDEISEGDLTGATLTNKLVLSGELDEKRYVELRILRPEKKLSNNSLDFSPEKIRGMIEAGKRDAEKVFG